MRPVELLELEPGDVVWPFESGPQYSVRGENWPTHIKVDPFPCARHDSARTRAAIDEVSAKFPIGCSVRVVTIAHEFDSRTNGFATKHESYDEAKKEPADRIEITIALSGKRTMVLPAMTRYLVAHEYGHAVDYWIDERISRGKDEFEKLYADARGVKRVSGTSGGRWAGATTEVIADDFRILVAGVEVDFWPHPVPHPRETNMAEFWARMIDEHAAR